MPTQQQKDNLREHFKKLHADTPENDAFITALFTILDENAGAESVLDTKGDLATFGAAITALAVGANGTVLSADSTEATGLKYVLPIDLVGGSEIVTVAADFDINNSETLADVTGLETSSLAIGRKYQVELLLIVEAASTNPDLDIKFVSSANTTLGWTIGGAGTHAAMDTIATEKTIALAAATGIVKAEGILDIVDTAGTLKLQAAQNSATVEDTTIKAGSMLKITRIE